MPSRSTDGFYRYVDIEAATGIASSRLRNLLKYGVLPEPDDRIGQSPVWFPATINAWINRRDAAYSYADIARETGYTTNALRIMLKAGHLPSPDFKLDKENAWEPATIKPWIRQHQLSEGAYTFAEITKRTGLSYNELRRLRKVGEMPEPDVRDGRAPAWSPEAINGWIQKRAATPEETPVVA
jgi:predicted DNA-binding transcriptional regulator AlpA